MEYRDVFRVFAVAEVYFIALAVRQRITAGRDNHACRTFVLELNI